MGQLDQFAKQTFADETEALTGGAASWLPPPELNLSEVRLDGLLLTRDPARLRTLPAPWSAAAEHDEIVVELKMQGDHLDVPMLRRALLRRQAREVQRAENLESPWEGEEALWVVAPHVPAMLRPRRDLQALAPGCFRVGPASFSFLWIAANELPLADELIPFLVARSGRALVEFGRWVATRRSSDWIMHMLEFVPMPDTIRDEILRNLPPTDDPERLRRRRHMTRVLLDMDPELRDELRDELRAEERTSGRLIEARSALRRVLARRNLPLLVEQEERIDTCTDLATLERWHDQAVTASTTADALR